MTGLKKMREKENQGREGRKWILFNELLQLRDKTQLVSWWHGTSSAGHIKPLNLEMIHKRKEMASTLGSPFCLWSKLTPQGKNFHPFWVVSPGSSGQAMWEPSSTHRGSACFVSAGGWMSDRVPGWSQGELGWTCSPHGRLTGVLPEAESHPGSTGSTNYTKKWYHGVRVGGMSLP